MPRPNPSFICATTIHGFILNHSAYRWLLTYLISVSLTVSWKRDEIQIMVYCRWVKVSGRWRSGLFRWYDTRHTIITCCHPSKHASSSLSISDTQYVAMSRSLSHFSFLRLCDMSPPDCHWAPGPPALVKLRHYPGLGLWVHSTTLSSSSVWRLMDWKASL